jgi:hypothetical protein
MSNLSRSERHFVRDSMRSRAKRGLSTFDRLLCRYTNMFGNTPTPTAAKWGFVLFSLFPSMTTQFPTTREVGFKTNPSTLRLAGSWRWSDERGEVQCSVFMLCFGGGRLAKDNNRMATAAGRAFVFSIQRDNSLLSPFYSSDTFWARALCGTRGETHHVQIPLLGPEHATARAQVGPTPPSDQDNPRLSIH